MKSHDKAFLISGMMFNVIFFLSMMMSVFITNAVAIAIVASTVTYLFRQTILRTKRLILTPMSNSRTLRNKLKIII